MQENFVKAFRQRLVRAMFTNIRIDNLYNGFYLVSCVSRDGEHIRCKMTPVEMNATPRLVWFDKVRS